MRTGRQGAAAALAQDTWPLIEGTTACLNFVTWMFDKAGTGYRNANAAWADQRNSHHPASETPPIGAVGVFLGGPNGDVAIRVPGGLWRSVNANPRDLHCVSQTTAQREASTGNRYAGWLGGLGGEPIDFTDTAGLDIEPIIEPPKRRERTVHIIRNWASKKVYLLNGGLLWEFPNTIDVRAICEVIAKITGQPLDTTSAGDAKGPWVNISDAEFKFLAQGMSLVPKAAGGSPDLAPLIASINTLTAKVSTKDEIAQAVITQIAS